MTTIDIFKASSEGDIKAVREALNREINLEEKNEFGFTALHCAAIGSNSTELNLNMEVVKLLVESGSSLETIGRGGRTALYLMAEFSPYVEQVEYLIGKGANPDVCDEQGNHITINAMIPETIELLSELTGEKFNQELSEKPTPVKLQPKEWRKANSELVKVFKELNKNGLVAIQDAGYTQSDGFDDCVEEYHKRQDKEKIPGFCFYTKQDSNRARDFGILPLGIWGATEGSDSATIKIGNIVTEMLIKYGLQVSWSGKSTERPEVYLHKFSIKNITSDS